MAARRPSLAQRLGKRIAALRIEAGLTQEALGWHAGLTSKGYLSRVESGKVLPSLDFLSRVAARLGIEVRDLLIFPEASDLDRAMDDLRRAARPKKRRSPG